MNKMLQKQILKRSTPNGSTTQKRTDRPNAILKTKFKPFCMLLASMLMIQQASSSAAREVMELATFTSNATPTSTAAAEPATKPVSKRDPNPAAAPKPTVPNPFTNNKPATKQNENNVRERNVIRSNVAATDFPTLQHEILARKCIDIHIKKWEEDTNCVDRICGCGEQFAQVGIDYANRVNRHHCRMCGILVCGKCSEKRGKHNNTRLCSAKKFFWIRFENDKEFCLKKYKEVRYVGGKSCFEKLKGEKFDCNECNGSGQANVTGKGLFAKLKKAVVTVVGTKCKACNGKGWNEDAKEVKELLGELQGNRKEDSNESDMVNPLVMESLDGDC